MEDGLLPLWICQITGVATDQRRKDESRHSLMQPCSESPRLIYPQSDSGSEEQKQRGRHWEMCQWCTVMPQTNQILSDTSYACIPVSYPEVQWYLDWQSNWFRIWFSVLRNMDCPICTVRMCVYLVQSQICFLLVICKLVGILNSHSEFIEIVMINQIPKCLSLLLWKWPRLPFPMGYFIYSAELQSSVFNESQSSGHHVLLRSSFCH